MIDARRDSRCVGPAAGVDAFVEGYDNLRYAYFAAALYVTFSP